MRTIRQPSRSNDRPIEATVSQLVLHALFVGNCPTEEDWHKRAVEERDIHDAVSHTERGDGDDATYVMSAHAGD
ncbi:MAG TPA: hypothetical protein VGN16_11930 [Acidobacteriaceae bacterium]